MSAGATTGPAAFQPRHFFLVVTMLAATAAVLMARETTVTNLLMVSAAVMATGLVAMAVYRTLAPLANPEEQERSSAVGGRTRLALEREKMLVMRSIKELEFDRAMEKIAEPDFQDMVARLRARAIGLMKQLDQHRPEWRDEIERELERRLGRRVTAPAAAKAACPSCGTANDTDARFCKSCGARLAA